MSDTLSASGTMTVVMPQLGETVVAGLVSTWFKQVGDEVRVDEPLFEVETEKVSTEIPAPASGVLESILVGANITVPVGTALAVIKTAIPAGAAIQRVPNSERAEEAESAEESSGVAGDRRLSPAVRRLLSEHRLSAGAIFATGRGGRLTREDVLAYVRKAAIATSPVGSAVTSAGIGVEPIAAGPIRVADSPPPPAMRRGTTRVPLNKIRRQTAEHMVRSVATSPHVLQAVEVNFEAVELVRAGCGIEWKAHEGFSLTYLPFVAYAVCKALAKYPYVNASFSDYALLVHSQINLGIAVDIALDGLWVPVVKNASNKPLRSLAIEANTLATKARRGTLLPDDVSEGTYTISNSGTFGTVITAPIIHQPQVAILSLDGIRRKPIVIETDKGESIGIRAVGVLAQCFDHRAFDGAYSASFLRDLKHVLEDHDWREALK